MNLGQKDVTRSRVEKSNSSICWNRKTALTFFFFCTLIIIFEFVAYSVRSSLLVIAIGIGLGVIFAPILDSLHTRFKTPRILNAIMFILGILILLGTMGFFLFDLLANQISSVAANESQIIVKVTAKISELLARYPWISIQFGQLELGSTLQNVFQQISHGVRLGGTFVAGAIISLVIGIYIAMNPSFYFDGILSLVPLNKREDIDELLRKIAVNLRKWLLSQLLAMSIVGVATTLVLWLIGVEYWFVFGVMAGLLDIVPYLGPILPLAALLVVNIAIDPEKIPWIIFAFIAIHQFENNFIVPLIFKYRMHFPPALLIGTMLIMGSLLGVIGLVFTPSLFSILQTIYGHYHKSNAENPGRKQQTSAEVTP